MKNKDSGLSGVREQLILAGIDEIKENGIVGFSQRRVAAACHVSCAAPYKWFGSREGLVQAIREYIGEQWELFARELIAIYKDDLQRQMMELSLGYLSFLSANPKFRTVLFYCDEIGKGYAPGHVTPCVESAIEQYAKSRNMPQRELETRKFMVYSLIIGATLLPRHDDGKFGLSDEVYSMVRDSVVHAICEPIPSVQKEMQI